MKTFGIGTAATLTLGVLLCFVGIAIWAGCDSSQNPTAPTPILSSSAMQPEILRNPDGTAFTGIRCDGTEVHPLYGPLPTIEVGIRGQRLIAPPEQAAPNGNFWNIADATIAYNCAMYGAT